MPVETTASTPSKAVDAFALDVSKIAERPYVTSFSRMLFVEIIERALEGMSKVSNSKASTDSIHSRSVVFRNSLSPDAVFYFPACTMSFFVGHTKPNEIPPVSIQVSVFNLGDMWKAAYEGPSKHFKMRQDGTFKLNSIIDAIVTAETDELTRVEARKARNSGSTDYRVREREAVETALGPEFSVFKSMSSYELSVRELKGIYISSTPATMSTEARFRVSVGTLENLTGAQLKALLAFIKDHDLRGPNRDSVQNTVSRRSEEAPITTFVPDPGAPSSIIVDDEQGTISKGKATPPVRPHNAVTGDLPGMRPSEVCISGSCQECGNWSSLLKENEHGVWACSICRTGTGRNRTSRGLPPPPPAMKIVDDPPPASRPESHNDQCSCDHCLAYRQYYGL